MFDKNGIELKSSDYVECVEIGFTTPSPHFGRIFDFVSNPQYARVESIYGIRWVESKKIRKLSDEEAMLLILNDFC